MDEERPERYEPEKRELFDPFPDEPDEPKAEAAPASRRSRWSRRSRRGADEPEAEAAPAPEAEPEAALEAETEAAPAPESEAKLSRARTLTLLATIMGSSISFLDMTVLTVALPTIANDMGFGLTGQQWVNISYLLSLTALYLLAGTIGDRLGQRRVFVAGTFAFAGASLVAGLAPDTITLIGARVAQGAAGAFLTTSSLALLRITWGSEVARGIGLWTAGTSIATIIGPLAGGLLTQYVNWRLIFLINLPLALVAIVLAIAGGTRAEQSARTAQGTRLDLLGALLGAAAITGLTWCLVQGQEDGYRATAWAGIGSAIALVVFVWRERHAQHAMLPLSLFQRRNFSVANLATFLIYAGLGGSMFYLVLYLQSSVVGYSATVAGLWSMPVSLALVLLAARFGRIADSRGPRLLLSFGPLLMAFGMLAFMLVDGPTQFGSLAEGMVLFGVGLAMVVAPITATALQSAPQRHSGIAAALNTALARLGSVVAVALTGVVITTTFSARVAHQYEFDPFHTGSRPAQVEAALVDAYRIGMLVSVVLVLAGAFVAASGISDAQAKAEAKGDAG